MRAVPKITTINQLEINDFLAKINKLTMKLPVNKRTGVVFIHGYNVNFSEAAIRAAQIGYDLKINGPMAFFSWPSQGSILGYLADEATIEASEYQISGFLQLFATKTGVETVHVIAHSMGNRALLRGVQRILSMVNTTSKSSFGHFILAAPDVDIDLFRQLSTGYTQVANHTTLYVSNKDKALQLSGFLHNYHRAGIAPPITVLPDIDTIHVGEVDLSFLGHGYIAETRDVLSDIHALIYGDLSPDKRIGLREEIDPIEQRCYWRIGG